MKQQMKVDSQWSSSVIVEYQIECVRLTTVHSLYTVHQRITSCQRELSLAVNCRDQRTDLCPFLSN